VEIESADERIRLVIVRPQRRQAAIVLGKLRIPAHDAALVPVKPGLANGLTVSSGLRGPSAVPSGLVPGRTWS